MSMPRVRGLINSSNFSIEGSAKPSSIVDIIGRITAPADIANALEKEAGNIRANIPKGAWFCVLTPEGKTLSSPAFAEKLTDVKLSGKSSACFLIGSSYGISESVKVIADFKLSMGAMTFPHHLARIMLLEQLYRAESIQAGSKYHK